MDIYEDEKFVKKGVNLPIELNGRIVGVVGISGEVEETRPFGNLLKSAVILLIEQSIALEKENAKINQKRQFFDMITEMDIEYTKPIIDQALLYGIHLTKPSQVMVIEFPTEAAEDIIESNPSFKISGHSLCIIVQDTDGMNALQKHVQAEHPAAYISVSKINDTVSSGYWQARAAMRVLKGVFFNERAISYSQCEFIADMAKLPQHNASIQGLTHFLQMDPELIKTLQIYINCNLNANETANQLIIHRNTLNYRLSKIHKLTGKDPKNILGLVELVFALIARIK
ncbi:Carbohydrate diacid regulator [compost metagenome]